MFDFFRGKKYRKENIYRLIVEETRNSLDLEMTIKTIINFVGKELNADRCFLMEYDKQNDRFKEHKDEYLSSPNLKSYIGVDLNKHIPSFVTGFKKGKTLIFNQSITKFDDQKLDLNNGVYEKEKLAIEEYKVYSAVVLPIFYLEEFLGDLVVHYVDKKHNAGADEIELLKTVSKQLAISIYHAKIFEQVKTQNEIKNAILNNLPFLAWLKDPNGRFLSVNKLFAKACNLTPDEILGKTDFDCWAKELAESYVEQDKIAMELKHTISREEEIMTPDGVKWHETFKSPVFNDNGEVIGTTGLARDISERKVAEQELLKQKGKILKYAQREFLLRKIIEKIRSSLDIDKILEFVCEETARTFGVQRVVITEFSNVDELRRVKFRKEYKTNKDLLGYHDIEHKSKISSWLYDLFKTANLYSVNNVNKSDAPDFVKNSIAKIGIKSVIAKTIANGNETWGMIVLSEYDKYRTWSGEEKALLEAISNQLFMAISQSKAYQKEKQALEREILLKDITEKIRSSLDIEEILSFICKEITKIFNVQRAAITSFKGDFNRNEFIIRKEYKKSPEINGLIDNEEVLKAVSYLTDYTSKNGIVMMENIQTSSAPDYFKQPYTDLGIKSLIGASIKKGSDVWGTIVLSKYDSYYHWTKEDENLLTIIANQIYIAIHQAELYNGIQEKAKNEKILRDIMLSFVQTLEMPDLIKNIVTQTGELLKADRCFFIGSDAETNSSLPVKNYAEYLSSPEIKSHTTRAPLPSETGIFIQKSQHQKVIFQSNIDDVELPEATRKFLVDDLSVKSYLIAPVYYGDIRYGGIVLHYVNDIKNFTDEEINIMIAIANQAAIVIHQAKLFENQKFLAERERINRNIIEILRSSEDKSIIKKLFVRNIGKYFNADRVFISEYQNKTGMYLPVDEDSEYLSDKEVKSLVGYDWSSSEIIEQTQPLLEKREIQIPNWSEYEKGNPNISPGVRALYEYTNTKSSYKFPVLHQTEIMGYFCIEFTKQACELSVEDINRIRNICVQAGIALFQAELLKKANESNDFKDIFIDNISKGVNEMLNNITDISDAMSNTEVSCEKHIEHINHINEITQKLLEFTNEINTQITQN